MTRAGEQSPRRLAAAAARREQALELYIRGATYAEIAKQLDYSRSGAHDAVKKALTAASARQAEGAHLALATVLGQLQMLWKRYAPAAEGGDPRAGMLCLQIIDRLIRLHGLDKIQIETTVTTRSELDAEIESLIDRLNGGTS